ncbi:MAG TPA: substrate-binding domain-containing protein [Longimicrobiaceae bacterium]
MRRSLAALTLLALLSACGGDAGPGAAGDRLQIAVIPKGTTHDFWRSIHAGALQAEQELNAEGTPVEVIWQGPLREDDREQQVQVVEGFIAQGVDGIVLAPLDDRALVRPVEEARRAGVPTVIIDSGLQSDQIVSFVATDNYLGGQLAADRMAELLDGEGRIIVLRYAEGSESTRQREEGFLERLRSNYPGIQVVSSDQYAGATRETAKTASENLLNRFSSIDGVYTPNESSTSGMLLALQDLGLADKVSFVGFDASQALVAALRAGDIDGLVVQNPMRMGYLGVRTMVDHLQGKSVEARIDTGVKMITPENLDDPESQELVDPPIEQYLTQ